MNPMSPVLVCDIGFVAFIESVVGSECEISQICCIHSPPLLQVILRERAAVKLQQIKLEVATQRGDKLQKLGKCSRSKKGEGGTDHKIAEIERNSNLRLIERN